MIFAVDGGALDAAARWVSRILPAQPRTPVLGGILLDARHESSGGTVGPILTLTALDTEILGAVSVTPSVVTEPGCTVVSGRLLAVIASVVSTEPHVRFSAASKLMVDAGDSVWTLPTIDPGLWPGVPGLGEPWMTLDGAELRTALTRCLPAAESATLPPVNGSVALEAGEGCVAVFATNKYQAALATIPAERAADGPLQLVVPTELLRAAQGALEAGPTELRTDGNSLTLTTTTHRITGRLTAGDWIQWRTLLPADEATTFITVETAALYAALKRAQTVLKDKEAVRLHYGPEEVSVFAPGATGDVLTTCAVVSHRGESGELAINPQYLRQGLRSLMTDRAELRFALPTKAMELRPMGNDGKELPGYRYLTWPRQLSSVRGVRSHGG